MTSFVEAPYVMAVALIENTMYYKSSVAIDDVCRCGIAAQQDCNAQSLDAVIKATHDDVYNAVKNYFDYFQLVDVNGTECITYADNKDYTDMINYFTSNLPYGILSVLRKVVHKVCELTMWCIRTFMRNRTIRSVVCVGKMLI